MGNCLLPPEARDRARRSHEVDVLLNRHGRIAMDEVKLLLLGGLDEGRANGLLMGACGVF